MPRAVTNPRTDDTRGRHMVWCSRFHQLKSSMRRRDTGANADVAQLVAHHLAKVRVASSSLVIRSSAGASLEVLACGFESTSRWRGREARHRPAKPFTRVRIPSPPPLKSIRAIGAAVARFPDTEEVTGSIPVSPTTHEGRPNGAAFVASRKSRDAEPEVPRTCTSNSG